MASTSISLAEGCITYSLGYFNSLQTDLGMFTPFLQHFISPSLLITRVFSIPWSVTSNPCDQHLPSSVAMKNITLLIIFKSVLFCSYYKAMHDH